MAELRDHFEKVFAWRHASDLEAAVAGLEDKLTNKAPERLAMLQSMVDRMTEAVQEAALRHQSKVRVLGLGGWMGAWFGKRGQ